MRQILKVQISKEKEYLIEISDNDFSKFNQDLEELTKGKKRLIVISKNVYKLYHNELLFNDDEIFILPDGEKEKNYKNYLKIIRKALELGLTRKDVIIAVGGGVVGDIAGFAASTYMRGIDLIQVPTTLLSAVDSSVGGKTAIDFESAKNIIGTFYQPKKVIININFFKTLDKRQLKSGMGEIIKYALIENSCMCNNAMFLFEFLTLGFDKISGQEPLTIIRMIEYCLNLKIAVVTQDEKEGGLRKILNLGHTLGHALESITNYRKYTHGEAVAYGLFFINDWAYNNKHINYSYWRHTNELLLKYDFTPLKKRYSAAELVKYIQKDKKATSDKITFIVPIDKKQVIEVQLTPYETECALNDYLK